MIRVRMSIGLLVLGSLLWAIPANAVRIKDVGSIEGVRDNQLIGYGLVVGLDRTGDQVIGGQFTIQAMMSMLNKMGINLVINPIQLLTRNIASVIVTAKLPPFAKPGLTVDVLVSSMANAKSLQGGTLLLTPLKAANQQVYAVAQGPVSIGGFLGGTGGAGGSTITKNHQAAGMIPGGAIIEKDAGIEIESWENCLGASAPAGFYDGHPDDGSDRRGVRKGECNGGEFRTCSGVDSGNISWPSRGVYCHDRRIGCQCRSASESRRE